MQNSAIVTRVEIARQTFILPKPSSGDVRWTLHVDSGRERADVYANAQGVMVGADLGGTQRAKTLDLLRERLLARPDGTAFRGR